MSVHQAVILAAGHGARCWPYTDIRPKALIPVGNQPIVDRLLGQLRSVGIEQMVVVCATDQRGTALEHHCKAHADVSVARANAHGPAIALNAARDTLDDEEPLLIAYGDVVTTTANLTTLVDAFSRDAADGACLIDQVPGNDARGWHVVEHDAEDGELSSVVTNPRSGNYRFSGIAVVDPSITASIASPPVPPKHVPVGGMPAMEADIAEGINVALEEGHRIEAVECTANHVDIDKPWHILEANRMAVRLRLDGIDADQVDDSAIISDEADIEGTISIAHGCEIGKRVRISGPIWMEPGARITNGAIVEGPSLIGENAHISNGAHVRSGSVVGPDCRIANNAEFGGVMFEGVYMVHYSQLGGLIGRRTDIGAATVSGGLRFDDGRTLHDTNGFIEQPTTGANSIYLGDHSRTGVNVTLLPGVKIGSYSCIGPGAIVQEDIESRTLLEATQTQTTHPWGPERYNQ